MGEINAYLDSRACMRFVYKVYEEEKAGLFSTRVLQGIDTGAFYCH